MSGAKQWIRHAEDCPEVERHTACPSNWLAWDEWADRMEKTHEQVQCPTCRFWSIWVPKPAAPSTEGTTE